MVTMEQLEQLEGRISKALELISDLRVENNHLEKEVDGLKSTNDQLKLSAEEKEIEAKKLQQQLTDATEELSKLKSKEKDLESRIVNIISKLDNLKEIKSAGSGTPTSGYFRASARSCT